MRRGEWSRDEEQHLAEPRHLDFVNSECWKDSRIVRKEDYSIIGHDRVNIYLVNQLLSCKFVMLSIVLTVYNFNNHPLTQVFLMAG